MFSVAVLMSTYNGEKFLREQIDSILRQQDVEISLYIRDDGSSDGTKTIIRDYVDNNKKVTFLQGDNLGVGNSFMSLVRAVGECADYYAFADQDDIWLSDKLSRAIAILERKTGPWCYCSNQTLIDASGKVLQQRHSKPIDVSYMQILCNNQVTGCTMVWNKDLQRILTNNIKVPSQDLLKKRIHDVWVAMVASVAGNIYYDENSYILYRQHENNVVGAEGTTKLQEWKKKLKKPELRNGRSDLADEITAYFADDIQDTEIASRLRSFAVYRKDLRTRLKLIADSTVCHYSGESVLMYKLKVALGFL